GGVDSAIRFWDARTGEPRGKVQGQPDLDGGVWALAYVKGGRFVAAAGRGVVLWEVATGLPHGPLFGPRDKLTSLVTSPAGTRLAGTSYDGSVCVWDTLRLLYRSDAGVGAAWVAAFTPDGGILSGGGGEWRNGKCEPGKRFTMRLWTAGRPD